MDQKTYAVVCGAAVVNMVVWDGESDYTPPGGCELVEATATAEIGGTYVDGEFHRIPQPEPEA